jgi:alcohol dehydrogenase YqhD (iron-dependent ADH family)
MQDFIFHNPTKIIFGKGRVPEIGKEARAFGRKALFVYGKASIKKSGLYDQIKGIMKEAGIELVEHGGVKSNPVLSHAREGIEKAKKEKIDFLLGVGGGSAIDEAKCISAGAVIDGDVWDFYTAKAQIQDALPVVAVLTIPATGTEMNGGTVITNEETGLKAGFIDANLHPRVSVLDPSLTLTIPPDYTAYSAVDAISHLIEGYFTGSDPWVPIQDRYVEGNVRSIMESAERCLKDPRDYQARATFMWAATLAWNGLGTAGIGEAAVPSHLLAHPLGGLYDLPHGASLSITIPAWMTWAHGKGNRKVAQFGRNVFGEKSAEKGIAALKSWFGKIGSPTSLAKADIPASDIGRITDSTLQLAKTWGLDQQYTRDVITELYGLCA